MVTPIRKMKAPKAARICLSSVAIATISEGGDDKAAQRPLWWRIPESINQPATRMPSIAAEGEQRGEHRRLLQLIAQSTCIRIGIQLSNT